MRVSSSPSPAYNKFENGAYLCLEEVDDFVDGDHAVVVLVEHLELLVELLLHALVLALLHDVELRVVRLTHGLTDHHRVRVFICGAGVAARTALQLRAVRATTWHLS